MDLGKDLTFLLLSSLIFIFIIYLLTESTSNQAILLLKTHFARYLFVV